MNWKPLTLRRPPVMHLPVSEVVGVAMPRTAALMAAAVEPGRVETLSATAPVACGTAIKVPLYDS